MVSIAYTYKGYNPANNKAVSKYNAEHYKRVTCQLDKDFYLNELKPICDSLGVPVATFIKQAVAEKIATITKK